MTVLGVIPQPDHVRLSLVGGTSEEPHIVALRRDKQQVPQRTDPGDGLLALRDFFKSFVVEHGVSVVAILGAVNGKYSPSVARVKVECAVQLGAREAGKEVRLITPQAFHRKLKKFEELVGRTPEEVFVGGGAFKAEMLRQATLVGWMAL